MSFLTNSFIASHDRPPLIILELDSTDDPAHGQQQLIEFNAFHNQYMYHPLLIHEGVTGCLLGTFLRPGKAHAAEATLTPHTAALNQSPKPMLLATRQLRVTTPSRMAHSHRKPSIRHPAGDS